MSPSPDPERIVKTADIRSRFINYFAGHGHTPVPSAALVPENDPTLYFVNAGMVPFKDVFTGVEQRGYTRATSVQKCLRVSGKHNDLENVGRTPRHHTFFEMLGNFSFGDYFKKDAIEMAWELLTGDLGLDAKRLWVTVYEDDQEAWDLWRSIGFPEARLQRLGAKDNFWSMGALGPCGPCTEIHYDHGPGVSSDTRGPAGEDDRYVEIWNLVFMQYDQQADGSRLVLPRPSIDTGSGLERIAAAAQGVYSNYETDAFTGIIQRAAQQAGVTYGGQAEVDVAIRVIADHARATAFLIGDGVMPSNEGRGYVLRRIMRRGIRFGVKAGINQLFLHEVVDQVGRDFGEHYNELLNKREFIDEVVRAEEERFRSTLERGMKLIDGALDKAGPGGTVPGDVAFTLSDTYGFPLDLTQLIASERGVTIDADGYGQALDQQKARGRAAWKGSGQQATDDLWNRIAGEVGASSFSGYPTDGGSGTRGVGNVVALLASDSAGTQRVDRLQAGDSGIVILDRTPFYGESGGQAGDTGTLSSASGAELSVTDTQKQAGLHLHHVQLTAGAVQLGDAMQANVASAERDASRRNHTATHLLHEALRRVLGEHVQQKGSLVAADRLRFDFAHHKPLSASELAQIESQVNREVLKSTTVGTQVMALDDAKAAGAMALFGEKYGIRVRVVRVPGYSVELCGGTHVGNTGQIGSFYITSEAGVAAGVRRIEAATGTHALAWSRAQSDLAHTAAASLKTAPAGLVGAIDKLKADRKGLERRIAELETEMARAAAGDLMTDVKEIGGAKALVGRFDGDLREQADRLRDQLGSAVVVLAATKGPKVLLLAACTKDLAGRVHCGNIIRAIAPLVGGGGGGRPDMAQAGGKDASGIDAALAKALELLHEQLGA